MELQHVNVKLLLNDFGEADLEPLIPIFHSWIQEQNSDELLLDVADYRHVHAGPGVILIGHEANYSVDNTGSRQGIRYNRKAPLAGSNQDRLEQAMRAALQACQRLESDSRLNGKLRFNGRDTQISINDRLLAPNNGATREAVQPELAPFLQKLFAGGNYSLSYPAGPRELFAVAIESAENFSSAQLIKNLAS